MPTDDHSYRQLVENSLGLMCVHDLEGRLTYVSPPAAEALGWAAEDGVGRSLRDYLSPPVEHLFDAYLEQIRSKGHDSGLMRLAAKDGAEHFWEYRNVVVSEPDRTPYVVGHAIDVTERVRADQALRETRRELEESAARHQSLVEGSALGICIQQDGVVQFANRRLAEMQGWVDPGTLVGQPFAALLAPGERERIQTHFADLLAGERVADRLEVEHVTRAGGALWVEAWTSVVMWRQALAVLVTVIDVSERKRLEIAVRGMERVEAMGRLAGGLAHVLTNQMAVVIGRGALLTEGLDGVDPRRRHAEAMIREASKAAGLARELLAFSRRLMLRPEPLRLGEVVAALSPRIRAALPDAISFGYTVNPGQWPAHADRAQIEAALLHLVDNARDAMPDGGLLMVEVDHAELDEASGEAQPGAQPGPHVVVSVQDTGPGLTPEAQAHLFEPFFTTKGLGENKGLGLSSVYGIVMQHGGHVEVDSVPGRGTTIRLYLPRAERATGPAVS